jgi:aminopeptidase N
MPTRTSLPTPVERFRKDYAALPYVIDSVSLDVDIRDGETRVTSTLCVHPQEDAAGKPLDLDGEDLVLSTIELDGAQLERGVDFELTYDGLRLFEPPANKFELKTTVTIIPEKNLQLAGLYKSGNMYVTQCEAQGFRRITFFQDRPDVMAKYDVRLEADEKYPVLLSNGNETGSGTADGGRKWATFSDPFRKPSYLFAIVAGDLGGIEGTFTTMNRREVRLCIWAEKENADQLDWSMQCLKDAMTWDENTYGREYDLDVYHVVAANDFNMGAMENKGLNIFNTAVILAQPATATDTDFERVQGVIGHEYFHNWSGNRVTVRDWFQLSLKEGLTNFRQQGFEEDMTSAAVRRIEEVRVIRAAQFPQDAGPMAHSVRPESYSAIDNFYTVTVYNKGAEVIRMMRTLIGYEDFRKGMELYFDRHDGTAVTCDDFRQAMADASGKNLDQFERWYQQAGTPTVTARSTYDAASQTYRLTLAQSTAATPMQLEKLPFHIPVVVGLLGRDGSLLAEEATLELTEAEQTFEFTGLAEEPVPSLLRGFSAPVKLKIDTTPEQLAFLAANDDDPFNRWDASQRLYTSALLELIASYQASGGDESKMAPLAPGVLKPFKATLTAEGLDDSLRAYSLALPDFAVLEQEMDIIDADAIGTALKVARRTIAQELKAELLEKYLALESSKPYAVNKEQVGARRLRNACLSYLSRLGEDEMTQLCLDQFRSAQCMTDSIGALLPLSNIPGPARDEALSVFYSRAKENNALLVINKWFSVQALADTPTVIDDVKKLLGHESFDENNPNVVRALVSTFAAANPAAFHRRDGAGYEFIADQVIDIDKRNPQVAARLANSFNNWKRHDDVRQTLMKAQLERIQMGASSEDTKEIVSKTLALA